MKWHCVNGLIFALNISIDIFIHVDSLVNVPFCDAQAHLPLMSLHSFRFEQIKKVQIQHKIKWNKKQNSFGQFEKNCFAFFAIMSTKMCCVPFYHGMIKHSLFEMFLFHYVKVKMLREWEKKKLELIMKPVNETV